MRVSIVLGRDVLPRMTQTIQYFLASEATAFVVGALIHFGFFTQSYKHVPAGIVETLISMLLTLALIGTWIRPAWTRTLGLVVQLVALLGTMAGVITIVIGVGPQTGPDIVYHAVLLLLLVWGLLETWRVAPIV